MINDPQEENPDIKKLVDEAQAEAKANLAAAGVEKTRGYVHKLWPEMKRILKEKHNLDWQTPAEMNPSAKFD